MAPALSPASQGGRAAWPGWLAAGSLYGLISVLATWPLLPKFDTAIYGGGADALAALWELWAGNALWTNGAAPAELVGVPFGLYENLAIAPHFPLYFAIARLPGLFPSAVWAYNFFTFAGFPGAALASHVLAYRLTKSHLASFAAGLTYSFAPGHQLRAQAHFSYDPQWLVWFLLALWWFDERPGWKRAACAGLALGITWAANPYRGYFAVIAGAVLVSTRLFTSGWRPFLTWPRARGYALVIGIALGVAGALFAPIVMSSWLSASQAAPAFNRRMYAHNPTWPFYLSARPWDYLLPSVHHPVWGQAAERARQQIDALRLGDWAPEAFDDLNLDPYWFWSTDGSVEHTLYLGYSSLTLAAIGIWRQWGPRRRPGSVEGRSALVVFVLTLGCVALLWSAPPWFPVGSIFHKFLPDWAHNLVIPFPIWFSFKVLPFRVVSRMGSLVLLSVSALAAVGLGWAMLRVGSPLRRAAALVAIAAVLLIEFASTPTLTPILPAPAVYEWLASQPGQGAVAAYPWNSMTDQVYQSIYRKPLAGHDSTVTFMASPIHDIQMYALADITDSVTPRKLAALGVEYLIWHKDALGALPATPDGLRLLRSFENADAYQVTAVPAALIVFSTPDGRDWLSNAQWSWTAANESLWVWNPTGDAIAADVILGLAGQPGAAGLLAAPFITRPPKQIGVDGVLQENPLYEAAYPPGTQYMAQLEYSGAATNLRFEAVVFLPGESRLDLYWSGEPQPIAGLALLRAPCCDPDPH
jgi:hypothetical protein